MFVDVDAIEDLKLESLVVVDLPQCMPNCRVHLNDYEHLVWPVLLLYPEFNTTDFIEEFDETTRCNRRYLYQGYFSSQINGQCVSPNALHYFPQKYNWLSKML